MTSTLRSTSKVFRYGGEEFVVVLPETGRQDASSAIERLINAIRQCSFQADEQAVQITASIGLAVYPEHSTDKSSLIKLADQALYNAKKAGRDRFTVSGELK